MYHAVVNGPGHVELGRFGKRSARAQQSKGAGGIFSLPVSQLERQFAVLALLDTAFDGVLFGGGLGGELFGESLASGHSQIHDPVGVALALSQLFSNVPL